MIKSLSCTKSLSLIFECPQIFQCMLEWTKSVSLIMALHTLVPLNGRHCSKNLQGVIIIVLFTCIGISFPEYFFIYDAKSYHS